MPKPSKIPLRSPEAPARLPDELPAQPPPEATLEPSLPPQGRGQPPGPQRGQLPRRRYFSAAEKLRIVREADACSERGEVEALLRREGLYSSHLSEWRRALRLYGEQGVATRGPGRPRTRDTKDDLIAKLEREIASLRRDLERMQTVIDVQKKLSALLGLTLEGSAR